MTFPRYLGNNAPSSASHKGDPAPGAGPLDCVVNVVSANNAPSSACELEFVMGLGNERAELRRLAHASSVVSQHKVQRIEDPVSANERAEQRFSPLGE